MEVANRFDEGMNGNVGGNDYGKLNRARGSE